MRLVSSLLYIAALACANVAAADIADLREGDMKKLVVHEAPKDTSSAAFLTGEGDATSTLDAYAGKYTLVNFWATWCAPCRKEMPTLSALQESFGGDQFQVVTIATGRNSPEGIAAFFEEEGIANLPHFRDPKQAVAREMAVLGLPITVLLDPQGKEIARLTGDADWNSDSARKIVEELLNNF